VSYKALDTVVLARDLSSLRLRAGDLGVVVEVYDADHIEVEFVTASGSTEALGTADVRPVDDGDIIAVRRFRRTA
jgi:hypothetical protein